MTVTIDPTAVPYVPTFVDVLTPAEYVELNPVTETVPADQVADALDDAADYIEKHGWCQNNLVSVDGRVCAMGALGLSQGLVELYTVDLPDGIQGMPLAWRWVNPSDRGVMEQAADALWAVVRADVRDELAHVGAHIPSWNDADDRTEQQVLDAFRKAAKNTRREAVSV